MAFKMRQSKFRHVFGTPLKKDQCYDNIRISKSSIDSLFCAVNPKSVAIVTEAAGGGAFLVLPLGRTGRVERDHPLVSGHKGAVLDIKWCPHNDDVIASCSEDCMIKVWQIPEEGILTTITDDDAVAELEGHTKRVFRIEWHPSALNILLSAGADNKMFLWNVGSGEAMWEIETPDIIFSMAFNYDGTRFATTCKDKMLRIFNTRDGDLLKENKCHDGSKPSQVAYLKDEKIFTTGFSRMSERQYALWDMNDLSTPMTIEMIDNSNGVIFPFYDQDTGMIFLCGKGDSLIRYYEVTDEAPYVHYLSLYQSKEAQRGMGSMPKRGLNVNNCEIARFYKLLNNGLCEVIPMTVPRKSDLFQDDLYPDTASDTPSLTCEEFMAGGKNSDPILISLRAGYVPSKKEKMSTIKKSNVLDTKKKEVTKGGPRHSAPAPQEASNGAPEVKEVNAHPHRASAPAASHTPAATKETHTHASHAPEPVKPAPVQTYAEPAPAPAHVGPTLPPDFDAQALQDDIRKLKLIVKAHERRIKTLEDKVAQFEANTSEEDGEEAA
ncbi:coronin-1C-A-like isoform X2 [Dreissena polymorpha]|uniref:coronin-1C-A-like isoform X2 n=1 Tax=Dreissena polymorpha TaxID=45954 RepID=UPI002264C865|nr:coronin-1C-A-like isoform X2 [Dreissena polymorpha]